MGFYSDSEDEGGYDGSYDGGYDGGGDTYDMGSNDDVYDFGYNEPTIYKRKSNKTTKYFTLFTIMMILIELFGSFVVQYIADNHSNFANDVNLWYNTHLKKYIPDIDITLPIDNEKRTIPSMFSVDYKYSQLINQYYSILNLLQIIIICGIGLWAISLMGTYIANGSMLSRMERLNTFTYSAMMISSIAIMISLILLYWSFFKVKGVDVDTPWEIDEVLLYPILFTLFTTFVVMMFPIMAPLYPRVTTGFIYMYAVVFGYLLVYTIDSFKTRILLSNNFNLPDGVSTNVMILFIIGLFISFGTILFMPRAAISGIIVSIAIYLLVAIMAYIDNIENSLFYAILTIIISCLSLIVTYNNRIWTQRQKIFIAFIVGLLGSLCVFLFGTVPIDNNGRKITQIQEDRELYSKKFRREFIKNIPDLNDNITVIIVAIYFSVLYIVWDLK